jgi:hypothetical protein
MIDRLARSIGGMYLMFLSPEASQKPECEMELHVVVLVHALHTPTLMSELEFQGW